MKAWIKTNLSKITLALALTGATTGTIGLIMGGLLTHNVNSTYSYENRDHTIVYGKYPVWINKATSSDVFLLYFSSYPQSENDIKWDGNYPTWYFFW